MNDARIIHFKGMTIDLDAIAEKIAEDDFTLPEDPLVKYSDETLRKLHSIILSGKEVDIE